MKSIEMKILIGVLYISLFVGCTANLIKTVEFGKSENCQKKLLIASQQSDFKDLIVKKMSNDLNSDYCFLKRIDVAALNNESDQNYDAVVIINVMKFMNIDKEVKDYLSHITDKTKFVVLTTTGKKGRVVEIAGIDAISSASATEKSDQLADDLSARVRRLFQQK